MWDCYKDKFKLQEVGDNFQMLQGGSVTSVNGKVGVVVLTAEDVGALPDTYEAPVLSVNEKTGAVVLDAGDIGYESTTVEDELGAINSALSSIASVTEIIDTASGAIASFPDGSGLPMRSLVAQINPVQAGTGDPSPDNIRPISGWTGLSVEVRGVNIAEFTHGKGIDTGGHIHDFATRSATVTPIKIDSTRQYKYVNSNSSNAGIYAVWNGETLVRRVAGIVSGTVMDTSGGDSLYVCGYSGDGDVLPETCGVFFADQYEEFKPYTGTTTTVTFPDSAGTVYGGSDEVVGGELTSELGMITLDGVTNKADGIYSNGTIYTNVISGMYNDVSGDRRLDTLVKCDILKGTSNTNIASTPYGISQNTGQRLVLNLPNISTVAEANTWLASNTPHVLIIFATPQSFTHAPTQIDTLFGQNNVWHDANGDTTVTYQANLKGYIDKVLGQ